ALALEQPGRIERLGILFEPGPEFLDGAHAAIIAGMDETDVQRLDKWLWHCRFYKTRSLATAAIAGGKVHLNADRVKPAHRVRIGDRLSVSLQGIVGEFEVLGLPARRGPAAEAQAQYLETAASAERRAKFREQQRLAQISRPRPGG